MAATPAPQWQEVELELRASRRYSNPYTDVAVDIAFRGPRGLVIRRPAFWDGGDTWRVRFASPVARGTWTWRSRCSRSGDAGLHGASGTLTARPAPDDAPPLSRRGLLRRSPGGRNVVHADGTPLFLVADTAWALPFRATPEDVLVYARDRQAKGYNAALLMTLQPDREAVGPCARGVHGGFDVAFEDLPQARLRRLRPEYFRVYDELVAILVAHGIVPVHQPVFHGFGWKGQRVAGPVVSPADYARYCRYLLARYGARPALWLVGADGTGVERPVAAGGVVFGGDAYRQPCGIHYNPWQDNDAHTRKPWLAFHLCQTGHNNEHRPEKVAEMHARLPVRGVANGEPTYEGMGGGRFGLGWWQGEEAWLNLVAGGTLGVFYGAASLWQWKVDDAEPGWGDWCVAPWGWRRALEQPGSVFPGILGKVLAGLPFTDMTRRIDLARGRMCVAVPGKMAVVWLPEGGGLHVDASLRGLPWEVWDPRTGEIVARGEVAPKPGEDAVWTDVPHGAPRVVVIGRRARV